MPKEDEPLAAIIAKYRKDIAGGQFFTPTQEYISRLLDSIEAAEKRKRASLEDALANCKQYAQKIERENEEGETRLDAEEIIATVDNEFAGIRPEPAPGNAAATRKFDEAAADLANLRAAVEKIRDSFKQNEIAYWDRWMKWSDWHWDKKAKKAKEMSDMFAKYRRRIDAALKGKGGAE